MPPAAEGAERAIEVCVPRAARLACRSIPTIAVARDERVARAIALRRANDPGGALAVLAGIGDPEASRARAVSLRARIALASGDAEAAVTGLSEGMETHLAAGRISDAGLDAFALAHTLVTHRSAFEKALVALDRAARATSGWDEGAAQIDYYRALALRDSGRPREALAALQASGELAFALGLSVAHRHAREVEARLLQSLGHHDAAMRTFAEVHAGLAPDESPCVRAEVLSERGWSELTALLAGALAAPPPDLRARLDEAHRLLTTTCPRPAEADNAAVNLALEALLAGDVDRAAELVRALDGAKRPLAAYVDVWRLDLAGRVALAQKRPRDALADYDRLAARARSAASPEPLLRALVGRGRALMGLGRRDDAIRAFEDAEELLDAELARLPAGEERAMFLEEQGASADALIDLLSGARRAGEALTAARRARSRNVRGALRMERVTALAAAERTRFEAALARYRAARAELAKDEERAWQRPRDAEREARSAREAMLRASREAMEEAFAVAGEAPALAGALVRPAPGEAWLLLHPMGPRACRVLAATAQGTRTFVAQASPADPPDALAAALLGPLDEALGDVVRLRVLTSGAWQSVDVHALLFRGKPLVARAAVVFALDLPPLSRSPAPSSGALVVANPEDDLPETEREAARARESPEVVDERRGPLGPRRDEDRVRRGRRGRLVAPLRGARSLRRRLGLRSADGGRRDVHRARRPRAPPRAGSRRVERLRDRPLRPDARAGSGPPRGVRRARRRRGRRGHPARRGRHRRGPRRLPLRLGPAGGPRRCARVCPARRVGGGRGRRLGRLPRHRPLSVNSAPLHLFRARRARRGGRLVSARRMSA